jgi:hypothetical protein
MKFKVITTTNGMLVKWTGMHNKVKASAIVAKVVKSINGYSLQQYGTKTKAFRKLGWELCNLNHYTQARQSINRQIKEVAL